MQDSRHQETVRRTLCEAYRRQLKVYEELHAITMRQFELVSNEQYLDEYLALNGQKATLDQQILQIDNEMASALKSLQLPLRNGTALGEEADALVQEISRTIREMLVLERESCQILEERLDTAGKQLHKTGRCKALRKLVDDSKEPMSRYVEVIT